MEELGNYCCLYPLWFVYFRSRRQIRLGLGFRKWVKFLNIVTNLPKFICNLARGNTEDRYYDIAGTWTGYRKELKLDGIEQISTGRHVLIGLSWFSGYVLTFENLRRKSSNIVIFGWKYFWDFQNMAQRGINKYEVRQKTPAIDVSRWVHVV